MHGKTLILVSDFRPFGWQNVHGINLNLIPKLSFNVIMSRKTRTGKRAPTNLRENEGEKALHVLAAKTIDTTLKLWKEKLNCEPN
jgi:hypothetical protein